jgi:hypothetical protein
VQVQRDAEMADRGSSMLLVLLILELFHGEEFNHLLDVIVEEQIIEIRIFSERQRVEQRLSAQAECRTHILLVSQNIFLNFF